MTARTVMVPCLQRLLTKKFLSAGTNGSMPSSYTGCPGWTLHGARRFSALEIRDGPVGTKRPHRQSIVKMKNFVFTMTTGRSGTKYLARLLELNLPDAECYHEIHGWDRFGVDTPDLSHMTLFNSQGNVEKVQAFWRSKLARIAATPRQFYVETSHLLMKGGLVENLAPLTEAGTVHLVTLERDPYDTIVSFRNRFDFLDMANRWLWYLDPEYPRNLVPWDDFFSQSHNGLCLWYILEIRARAARYEKLLSGEQRIVFHHFSLEDLRNPEGASRLLNALGVRLHPANVRMPGPENVGRLLVSIDPAEQAEIHRLIAVATAAPARQQREVWSTEVPMRISA